MGNIIKDKKIILAILCLALFVFIVVCVVLNLTENVDKSLYELVRKTNFEHYFRYVTELGDAFVFLVIILFVFVLTKEYNTTLLVICNVLGIFSINFLLKNIFVRQRPNLIAMTLERGFSFPSGHSAVSTAVYLYLLYLIFKKCKHKWIRCISAVVVPILIVSICISRVYIGVHYVTDVTAGFLLGMSFTMIYIFFTDKYLNKPRSVK